MLCRRSAGLSNICADCDFRHGEIGWGMGAIFTLHAEHLTGDSKMSEVVKEAKRRYESAARSLVDAVKREYPVHSVVSVTIGKSTFQAVVTGHNECWWSGPGEIFGINVNTGKTRRFRVSDIN